MMLVDFQETKLSNGVRIVTSTLPHVESVAFGIWVGVGSRHETNKVAGVSHFIEHLLFKGTKKRSARAISQDIEGHGGYLNAFTQEESTCYYARVAYDHIWKALDVLSDMYLNPKFDSTEIDKERGVIIEEIMMYKDRPHQMVQEELSGALWSKHELGRPVIGYSDVINNVSRGDILSYKKNKYVAGNTIFVFAGKVDHEECVRNVRKYVGRMAKKSASKCKQVTAKTKQTHIANVTKDIEQTHLALGFRLFGRCDRKRYRLKIMNTVLGENMSSRLFQTVREKHGLAYSIHSHSHLFSDSGALVVSAGLDKNRDARALKLIVKEINRLKDSKVNAKELGRAKDYVIGQLRLGLESTATQMMWLGDNVMAYDKFIAPEETMDMLSSVTADDVQKLAKNVFKKSKSSLAVISPNPAERVTVEMKQILEKV